MVSQGSSAALARKTAPAGRRAVSQVEISEPEHRREYQRNWRRKHREHRIKQQRQWRKMNLERARESGRRWARKNSERTNAQKRQRRKAALQPTKCAWCGTVFTPPRGAVKYCGDGCFAERRRWEHREYALANSEQLRESAWIADVKKMHGGQLPPSDVVEMLRLLHEYRRKKRRQLFKFDGESLRLPEWARRLGIPRTILHDRIHVKGWSVERALLQPLRKSPS